ncbi:serine--tRNA ligase [Dehalococcoidia bacterium]|nr:serine--tRNA ligase [Dehalococcoidia bacterium]
MIDIEFIRNDASLLKEAASKRGKDFQIDEAAHLDEQRRSFISEADNLRARRNEVSRDLSKVREKPDNLIQEMRAVGAQIKELENKEKELAFKLDNILLNIPNIPSSTTPVGADEDANVEVRIVGEPRKFDFDPKPHWELGETLGIIDSQRAVKISQSRFYLLKGAGAKLQRALIQWMLDIHTENHGYSELYLPYMVNRETVIGSSHLPHFEENMYHDAEDDLFMVPTAEAPFTGMMRDEVIDEADLPLHYVAHTPCWRREKFSAGRDTRGIKRVHQFDKVEMYKFVHPDHSYDELESLVADAEDICQRLAIPHRVLELCTGDLGFAASKSFDVELWGAGTKEWLEVSSCSNCTDFQSRRSKIRFKPTEGGRNRYMHTLNGSGLAIPRVLIAIMEYFQNEDGSISVPEALIPYTGFNKISSTQ